MKRHFGEYEPEDDGVILSGANADLFHWACRSTLGRRHIMEPVGSREQLRTALGSSQRWGVSARAAQGALLAIWRSELGIGPYPLGAEVLPEVENRGVFYLEYREHTIHQLRVYILGLMLYEVCSGIRTALHAEVSADGVAADQIADEAIRRWKAAALAHDVGYILETPLIDPNFAKARTEPGEHGFNWVWLQERINTCLKTPVALQLGEPLTREIESDALSNTHYTIESPTMLENVLRDEKGSAKYLQVKAGIAGMGAPGDRGALLRYYDLAQKYQIDQTRPPFRDHGITGSLLLLCAAKQYRKHLQALTKHEMVPDHTRVGEAQAAANRALKNRTLWAAASAIALHNVDMCLFSARQYAEMKLTPKEYKLRLDKVPTVNERESRTAPNPAGNSLAFLLGLSDTIQDWDRQLFRSPRQSDRRVLSGLDFRILPGSNCVHLAWDSQDGQEHEYNTLISRLSANLDQRAVLTHIKSAKIDFELEDDVYRLNLGAIPSSRRRDREKPDEERVALLLAEYRCKPPAIHTIDDVFQITSERTDAIRRLLRKEIATLGEEPTNLLSRPLDITHGFVSPLRLLTGLITKLDESWPDLVQSYGALTNRRYVDALTAFHLYIQFCWLAWGPSVDMTEFCQSTGNPLKVAQISLGDEANSLPLIVEKEIWPSFDGASPLGRGAPFSIKCAKLVNPARDPFFEILRQQPLMNGFFDRTLAVYCGAGSAGASFRIAHHGCYNTAYVWMMLEQVSPEECRLQTMPTEHRELEPCRVVPFFEHANIASAHSLRFLQECLARKAIHHILACAGETAEEGFNTGGFYRYSTSLFDREMAGEGGLEDNDGILQHELAKLGSSEQEIVKQRLWIPPYIKRRTPVEVVDFVEKLEIAILRAAKSDPMTVNPLELLK